MTAFLITAGSLLGLSLAQAVAGILFFRPFPALAAFFFQSLTLFMSAFIVAAFDFSQRFLCGWLGVGLFVLLFTAGFRDWRAKKIQRL